MCATVAINAKEYSMPSSTDTPAENGNITEAAKTSPVGTISQLKSSQRTDDICDTISRHCRKDREVNCQEAVWIR
jgi:hypothetical protein